MVLSDEPQLTDKSLEKLKALVTTQTWELPHRSIESNITIHHSCIDKVCDYKKIQDIQVIDMMICASWTWDMFSCMVDGRNHEPCCRRRG